VRPGFKGADGKVYEEGVRSSTWNAGHVGLSYGYWDEEAGEVRRVGSLGMTGPREEMEKHVGRVAEVKHYGVSPDNGALRHPVMLRWRDDKSPEQCVFNFKEV
jgi:hypothetical protein